MAPEIIKIWNSTDLKAEYRKWHLEKFGSERGNQSKAAEYFGTVRQYISKVLDDKDAALPNKAMRKEIGFKKGPRGWVPVDEGDNNNQE